MHAAYHRFEFCHLTTNRAVSMAKMRHEFGRIEIDDDDAAAARHSSNFHRNMQTFHFSSPLFHMNAFARAEPVV